MRMMMAMVAAATLDEFLLARIADDVRQAEKLIDLLGDNRRCDPLSPLDPIRIKADCEATRRIVDLHRYIHECHMERLDINLRWCSTLRLLAVPYADHPDYLPEWRP